ncbi:HTH-type transcriptional regulator SrpR [compost metagenome]
MSPRTSEQNEQIRNERLQQIMKAAVEVYLEKGVRAADIGEIAQRAGIARGLVYYYFKDKIELFQTLFIRSSEAVNASTHAALTTPEPVRTRLEKYALFLLKSGVDHPQMVRMYIQMTQDLDIVFEQEGAEYIKNFNKQCTAPLMTIIEEGIRNGSLKPVNPQVLYHIFKGGLNEIITYLTTAELTSNERQDIAQQTVQQLLAAIEN